MSIDKYLTDCVGLHDKLMSMWPEEVPSKWENCTPNTFHSSKVLTHDDVSLIKMISHNKPNIYVEFDYLPQLSEVKNMTQVLYRGKDTEIIRKKYETCENIRKT